MIRVTDDYLFCDEDSADPEVPPPLSILKRSSRTLQTPKKKSPNRLSSGNMWTTSQLSLSAKQSHLQDLIHYFMMLPVNNITIPTSRTPLQITEAVK